MRQLFGQHFNRIILPLALLFLVMFISACSIQDKLIPISDGEKYCLTNEDCKVVSPGCGSCSCGEPINRKYVGRFQSRQNLACFGHQGGICQIACRDYILSCENHLCVKNDVKRQLACEDKDEALDYFKKGEVISCFGPTCSSETDFCPGNPLLINGTNPNELIEYYCENDVPKKIEYICPNGCKDGACVRYSNFTMEASPLQE